MIEAKTSAGTSYLEIGSGAALVLIHGVGLNKWVWQPQWHFFSSTHRVIAYDTIGHGSSVKPDSDIELDVYYEQLIELMDSLGLERINLCGHSMGALITVGFSLKYPERVDRIIPMMAAYDRSAEHQIRSHRVADILAGPDADELLNSTLERWFTEQDHADAIRQKKIEDVKTWLQQAHKLGYSRAYRVFSKNGETYVGLLGGITAPALFITAEFDPNSTPDMSRAMADEVKNGQVYIMEGERHMGQYLAAASLEATMLEFLQCALIE